MTKQTIELSAMPTPNPNAIKFVPNKQFFESGSVDFPNSEKAENSPLPKALFEINGVEGVMVGFNFISVNKSSDVSWEDILESVRDVIYEKLEAGIDPVDPVLLEEAELVAEHDSEIVAGIKKILDEEIRPAIALDGGDVSFRRFEDGVVVLYLQGACSTCPASTMTLKMGIENRLKEDFPEIKEVIQEI